MDNICNFEQSKKSYPEGCTRCELHKNRTNIVWARPQDACPFPKIMIIGEAPGEQEDIKGIPFVGRSGDLLTKALFAAFDNEYFWTKVYNTNTVKCRPPG